MSSTPIKRTSILPSKDLGKAKVKPIPLVTPSTPPPRQTPTHTPSGVVPRGGLDVPLQSAAKPLPKVSAAAVKAAHEAREAKLEEGKSKGGRGNKKEVVLPFDASQFPPVVNIKSADSNAVVAGMGTVYIGRDDNDPKGRGRFGNPFKIGAFNGNRHDVCERFKKWLSVTILYTKTGDALLQDIRSTLRDKPLACFCKPLECHGDFLVLIANAPEDQVKNFLKKFS